MKIFLVFCTLCLLSLEGRSSSGHDTQRSQERAAKSKRHVENIRFANGSNVLSGVLVLPLSKGPCPAIVFIYGSGPCERTYSGLAPPLWDYFVQYGFACLSWDRPGVGESSGNYNDQTFDDRAQEVSAAIRFLNGRKDISHGQIGLWGHSQGGMVAPLVASISPNIAFLIEVSGWQGPVWQQDMVRIRCEMKAAHLPDSDVQEAIAFARIRMELIRSNVAFEELERRQKMVERHSWFTYVHNCDRTLFYSARKNVEYDTSRFWTNVHCPVLALYGANDTSSGAPEPLIEIIRSGLSKAGNTNLTMKVFSRGDHALCDNEKARNKEFKTESPEPHFVPGYLLSMSDWLKEVCARFASSLNQHQSQ